MNDLEQPLVDLEREFQRRDPFGAGVVSRSEFTFVLVRNGGMLTQIDALADTFSSSKEVIGVDSTVNYARFIDHMKSLASGSGIGSHGREDRSEESEKHSDKENDCLLAANVARDAMRCASTNERSCVPSDDLCVGQCVSLRVAFKALEARVGTVGSQSLSLREIFNGFREVGIFDVSLMSLEALCDGIFDDERSNRRLRVDEFCTLVSRLPEKTIQLLRTASTWERTGCEKGSHSALGTSESTTRTLNFEIHADPTPESTYEDSRSDPPLLDSQAPFQEVPQSSSSNSEPPLGILRVAAKPNGNRFEKPTRSSIQKLVKNAPKGPQTPRGFARGPVIERVSLQCSRSSSSNTRIQAVHKSSSVPSSHLLSEVLGPKCNVLISLCAGLDQTKSGLISFDALCAMVLTLAQDRRLSLDDVRTLLSPYRAIRNEDWADYSQLLGDVIIASPGTTTPKQEFLASPQAIPTPEPLKAMIKLRHSRSPSIDLPTGLSLEERVRAGQKKIQRLLQHELLDCCNYDGQCLIDQLSLNSVFTNYVAEKHLRSNIIALFKAASKSPASWIVERAVKVARHPFESDDKELSNWEHSSKERAKAILSQEHFGDANLCDLRYLLVQLGVVAQPNL